MKYLYGSVPLFNGIPTVEENPRKKDGDCTIKPLVKRDKRMHASPKAMSLKVNVIARLEFELAY